MNNSDNVTSFTIHIVYPVLRGKRRFKIERGRRWSVVEHLLLQAVSGSARSAGELADQSKLPRRVVVEALTRLMRAAWVEIETKTTGLIFKATAGGLIASQKDDLPSATTLEAKWRNFYIDDATGAVFGKRDIVSRRRQDLPQTNAEQHVYEIPRKGIDVEDLSEVFNAIEGQDEFIVGVYPNASRLVQTFGLITVKNGIIEGMPKKSSVAFTNLINTAYSEAKRSVQTSKKLEAAFPALIAVADKADSLPKSSNFEPSDLIFDGKRHKEVLEATFKGARERILIHSTFVTKNAKDRLPLILSAAGRGVKIDILWGQEEQETGNNSSQNAIEFIRKEIAGTGRRDLIRIHPFSTGSHAKIIIADDRSNGWIGLIGSCNWMASDLESFDASVRIRDFRLIGELTNRISTMSHARLGVWNDTSQDFATLGRRIAATPPRNGRKAMMKLLYTGDHSDLPMLASSSANERIFVTSHRLGVAGKAVTIFPLMAASAERKIPTYAYYGKTTGNFSGLNAAEITREYARLGFQVTPVSRPRLHAKVLGWDNNVLAITSFNWLSADPNANKPLREIGVFVESNRIADSFLNSLDVAQWD